MRSGWLVVASMLVAVPAGAEHGDPFMMVSPPPGTTIPLNAHIWIESHNGIAYGLDELATKKAGFSAVLVAADHEIKLAPVSYFDDHDSYGAGLLVLAPSKKLHAATTYRFELRWPGGTPDEFALPWSWTTARTRDERAPVWAGAPTADAGSATLHADPGSETPILGIVADLTPKTKGTTKRLSLLFDFARVCGDGPTTDYTLAIARTTCPDLGSEGLCQVAYMHDAEADVGRTFSVKLTAVDLAGNRKVAPGPRPTITWGHDNALTVCLPMGTPVGPDPE